MHFFIRILIFSLIYIIAPGYCLAAKENHELATLVDIEQRSHIVDGLLSFYQEGQELHLEIPASLLNVVLGFTGVQVNALGDISIRNDALDTRAAGSKGIPARCAALRHRARSA